jgi:hypothetical protein
MNVRLIGRNVVRECSDCKEEKEDKMFYSKGVSGWSRLCITCRKRKHKTKQKQKERLVITLKAKAEEENKVRESHILANKLKLLRNAFNRFTLVNRDKINILGNKIDAGTGDWRTAEAYIRRVAHQELAAGIYKSQVEQLIAGVTPLSIDEIWSNEYGNESRKESEETDNEDIG